MKIFLAGATGVVGRPLIPRLVEDGHTLFALTRHHAQVDAIHAQGADAIVCDVFDRERLLRTIERVQPDVIVNQLTSLPSRINPRRISNDLSRTNELRTRGARLLTEAATMLGVRRMVAQSVAFYYDPSKREHANESEPLYADAPSSFSPAIEAIETLESLTLTTPDIDGTVLRYGYFYGPGTAYAKDGAFARDVKKGRVPIAGDGEATFSFVHVADAARATAEAIRQNATGIFNVVDDVPVQYQIWLPAYAKLLGAPKPRRLPRLIGRVAAGAFGLYFMNEQRGASNRKIKTELGWQPSYRNAIEGFREDLKIE